VVRYREQAHQIQVERGQMAKELERMVKEERVHSMPPLILSIDVCIVG
jgi:hypothetical protein